MMVVSYAKHLSLSLTTQFIYLFMCVRVGVCIEETTNGGFN